VAGAPPTTGKGLLKYSPYSKNKAFFGTLYAALNARQVERYLLMLFTGK